MQEAFLTELEAKRLQAEKLGVRIRPITDFAGVLRVLSGSRTSDGFDRLAQLGKLSLSLEALAVSKKYTVLFTDEQANTALDRLLGAGYTFM